MLRIDSLRIILYQSKQEVVVATTEQRLATLEREMAFLTDVMVEIKIELGKLVTDQEIPDNLRSAISKIYAQIIRTM